MDRRVFWMQAVWSRHRPFEHQRYDARRSRRSQSIERQRCRLGIMSFPTTAAGNGNGRGLGHGVVSVRGMTRTLLLPKAFLTVVWTRMAITVADVRFDSGRSAHIYERAHVRHDHDNGDREP